MALSKFAVMIFIFGYHPIKKNIGPVSEQTCANCNNTRYWLLHKVTYYINLFFIPLIPTKITYSVNCPVCNFKHDIPKEDFTNAEPLAKLNKEALTKNMSNEEYNQRLNQL